MIQRNSNDCVDMLIVFCEQCCLGSSYKKESGDYANSILFMVLFKKFVQKESGNCAKIVLLKVLKGIGIRKSDRSANAGVSVNSVKWEFFLKERLLVLLV